MDIIRLMGFFAVIPTVLLITLSFFVMFTLSKVEKSSLRIFGMVTIGLLWIAAVIIFSTGLLLVANGPDFYGDHGVAKCCSKKAGYSYHNKMMYQQPGTMMNPHEGIMDPHHGLMMNPHEEAVTPGTKK